MLGLFQHRLHGCRCLGKVWNTFLPVKRCATESGPCIAGYWYSPVRRWIIISFIFIYPVSAVTPSQGDRPDLRGVWKTSYVSLDDPRWSITDLACSGWCSLAASNYLEKLLSDPKNNARPVKVLLNEAQDYGKKQLDLLLTPLAKKKQAEYDPANDPAVDCDPDGDGLRHQITAPLPIRINQFEEKILINYEYWKAVRTIYMDGRGHPEVESPGRLGHSIGWYEGQTLVIETKQILPALISLPGGYIRHSSKAVLIERYARSGNRLDLVWEIHDPIYFRQPYKGLKASLLAPNWELDEFVCEAITGEY